MSFQNAQQQDTYVSLKLKDASRQILSRLQKTHRKAFACAEILSQSYSEQRSQEFDGDLLQQLLDHILNTCNEFHHLLKRRASRLLSCRIGEKAVRALEMTERENALWNSLEELLAARDKDYKFLKSSGQSERLTMRFCHLLQQQIVFEEEELFPLLKEHLTKEDWDSLCEETDAYDALWSAIVSPEQPQPRVAMKLAS